MIILRWLEKLYFTYQNSLTFRMLADILSLLKAIWIWILVGAVITAVLKTWLPQNKLIRFFRGKQHASIAGAALMGVVSPLGTYAAVPLAGALASAGIPVAALLAFVTASPLIDPNLFFLTAGTFGYEMAFYRLAAAVLIGLSAGYLARFLTANDSIAAAAGSKRDDGRVPSAGAGDKGLEKLRTIFLKSFFRNGLFIGKTVLLGAAVAAAVKNTVPPDFILHAAGKNPLVTVLAAAGAGVPLYACGGAAIPIMRQLSEMGLGKGAVLAFFISGPATKISTLVMMKSVFRGKAFWLYLAVTMAGAVFFGIVVDLIG
jgi:uncharacterized membrane protein YraQ (UPF0718 family)